MPRYIIDFVPDDGPAERIVADFADREAARMFVLHHATTFFERQDRATGTSRATTTIEDEDGELVDSIHSIADRDCA